MTVQLECFVKMCVLLEYLNGVFELFNALEPNKLG